jgi:hypothetical protein
MIVGHVVIVLWDYDHLAELHALICCLSPEGSFAPKTVQFDVTPIKLVQIHEWSGQPNP